jgi:4-hydroxy-3-polyprenylbenzoate decarboxylase
MLKEKRPLVLVPRETPLNQVHLQNLLSLAQMGVTILPAMPAFYHHPQEIAGLVDFVVGRVMEQLGLTHRLYQAWGGPSPPEVQ